MNKIYIVSGYARSGKTSAEKHLCKYNKSVHIVSSIAAVKNAAYRVFGWDEDKSEEGREFLSNLKLAWNQYNQGADRAVADNIKQLIKDSKEDIVVFVDIREPYFIADFKRVLYDTLKNVDYSVETILIERPDTMDMYECATLKGVYSGSIPDMYDYYIQTNDLDQLCQILNDIVEDKYIN